MDMNTVQLVGRLADSVRYNAGTDSTSSRCVGRLIINRRPSKDGKRRYDAVQFVAWGKTADSLAQYTDKGKELGITGELRVNNIQPEKEGDAWKNYTEVLVHNVSFGRDSNQQKMQKALQDGDADAVANLAGVNFSELFAKNPEMVAQLRALGAQAAGSGDSE